MLTRKTYTPDTPPEAAILPGVADHLRAQVARELVRLRVERGRGGAGFRYTRYLKRSERESIATRTI